MKRKRIWTLAGVAALTATLIAAGAVWAQSGEEGADGTSFLDRVAQKLGIDRPKLDQAIKDSRNEEIDEAVANRDLTQEQADRLKQRLEELPDELPGFGLGFGHKEFRGDGGRFGFEFKFGGRGFGFGFGNGEIAEFLGISQDQLGEELAADGATLASVAEAHGKTRDELKAFILEDARTSLDEAVANGDLTREQADEHLAQMGEKVDDLIDNERFAGWPIFGFKPGHGAFGLGFSDDKLAEFLGISDDQLDDELSADGATLATVAEAHGKTRDELKAFILADMRAKLDAAVADGTLTQERADALVERFGEHVDRMIDHERGDFGGFLPAPAERFHFGGEFEFGEDDAEPGATAADVPAGRS